MYTFATTFTNQWSDKEIELTKDKNTWKLTIHNDPMNNNPF